MAEFISFFIIQILINRNNIPYLMQIKRVLKFIGIGGINTLIDAGILNLFVLAFGFVSELWLGIFNMISFSCAVVNSYFMNRKWTFQTKSKSSGSEFFNFFGVSVIGCFLNTLVIVLGSIFLLPIIGLPELLGINVLKIMATLVSMIWNYIGYSWLYNN